jgi:hypothetical protein
MDLTDEEKREILKLMETDKSLSDKYRFPLFASHVNSKQQAAVLRDIDERKRVEEGGVIARSTSGWASRLVKWLHGIEFCPTAMWSETRSTAG